MDKLSTYEYFRTDLGVLYTGSVFNILPTLKDESVSCVVTSPPYWGLRDYGTDGQIGLEPTPEEYVEKMVDVFREVKRVLRDDGTVWLNLGDSYASGGRGNGANGEIKQKTNVGLLGFGVKKAPPGYKPKDLIGIPWRVAFALQADGWYLRQDIIWAKPNPMPESVTDRCTKAHEYIFLLSKSGKYFYNVESIKEKASNNSGFSKQRQRGVNTWDYGRPGYELQRTGGMSGKETYGNGEYRNKRSVWTCSTKPFSEAHFATFPPELIQPCILAGCPEDGTVLDPFFGAGTTGYVCEKFSRKWAGIEINKDYAEIAKKRILRESSQLKMF